MSLSEAHYYSQHNGSQPQSVAPENLHVFGRTLLQTLKETNTCSAKRCEQQLPSAGTVKADSVLNSLTYKTTSSNSSLFEKSGSLLNTNQYSANKANVKTSKDIDERIIMDNYDKLTLDK